VNIIVTCSKISRVKSLGDCLLKGKDKWERCAKRMGLIYVDNYIDTVGEYIDAKCYIVLYVVL
jgi:hypothetical protein